MNLSMNVSVVWQVVLMVLISTNLLISQMNLVMNSQINS